MEQVKKKKLGGYPAIGVVLSTTLALLVMGIFGLILSYTNQLEDRIRENITVKLYLKNNLSETQLRQIQQLVSEKEFVAKAEGALRFVSRDEAEKDLGDVGNFKEILGDNPLKDMLDVRIAPEFHDAAALDKIKAELEKVNGVFEVIYERDTLDKINENFTKISLVLLVITAVLVVAVVLLIHNTLRLALFSQRFLIRSMQLVGARQGFIQRPFLVRAALYGVLAGVLAGGMLTLLTRIAYDWIEKLDVLHNPSQFWMILGGIVLMGVVIAVASTYTAIRKYIHMTLDELY
jgi:cell division transport system permease protein